MDIDLTSPTGESYLQRYIERCNVKVFGFSCEDPYGVKVNCLACELPGSGDITKRYRDLAEKVSNKAGEEYPDRNYIRLIRVCFNDHDVSLDEKFIYWTWVEFFDRSKNKTNVNNIDFRVKVMFDIHTKDNIKQIISSNLHYQDTMKRSLEFYKRLSCTIIPANMQTLQNICVHYAESARPFLIQKIESLIDESDRELISKDFIAKLANNIILSFKK